MIARWTTTFATLFGLVAATVASAATLPPHGPLRILIVSDQVNPHGLSNAQLTQPGDISAALGNVASGLNIDTSPNALIEIATDNLATATAALSVPIHDAAAYDVLIYFAHRIPNGANGSQLQAEFVAAVNAFLVAGGGVISFHHGSYFTTGKEAILDIIGGTVNGAVPWDTVDGQNVIDVAPGHFITTNGIEYAGTVSYADLPRGIPSGSYSLFNNTPDERYPSFVLNPTAGTIEMLFASNYSQGGTTHVLGFTHRRAEWAGVVVVYQPGEYQPNALDNLEGNNFQILANAIVYAATGSTTGVEDSPPGGLALTRIRPNPFRSVATIDFALPEAGAVEVAVFDVTGRRLSTLVDGWRNAGPHQAQWNGQRDDGTRVPSGIYFCRVSTPTASRTRCMVLVN